MYEDIIDIPILELTDEITKMKNDRLMDVLGYFNHLLQTYKHDPVTPEEMVQELQNCINHINLPGSSSRII